MFNLISKNWNTQILQGTRLKASKDDECGMEWIIFHCMIWWNVADTTKYLAGTAANAGPTKHVWYDTYDSDFGPSSHIHSDWLFPDSFSYRIMPLTYPCSHDICLNSARFKAQQKMRSTHTTKVRRCDPSPVVAPQLSRPFVPRPQLSKPPQPCPHAPHPTRTSPHFFNSPAPHPTQHLCRRLSHAQRIVAPFRCPATPAGPTSPRRNHHVILDVLCHVTNVTPIPDAAGAICIPPHRRSHRPDPSNAYWYPCQRCVWCL